MRRQEIGHGGIAQVWVEDLPCVECGNHRVYDTGRRYECVQCGRERDAGEGLERIR